MKQEYDEYLCKTYPKLFAERNLPMDQTCMCWGFSHGDGWFGILKALCSNIEHHVSWKREQRARALVFNRKLKRAIAANDPTLLYDPKLADQEWHINDCVEKFRTHAYREVPEKVHRVVVQQVKEKFGTLRFYYRGGDEYVAGLVAMAESMSASTCEKCGVPGKPRNNGWVHVYCDDCEDAYQKERNELYGDEE